jgi:signal transduction histidine kinase
MPLRGPRLRISMTSRSVAAGALGVKQGGTPPLPQPDPQGPEQRALRAAAFDGAPWPILVLSANGVLKAANEAAEMLFGQALAALSRRGLAELTRDGELIRLFNQAVAEDGFVHHGGVEVGFAGAQTFEAEVTFSLLPSGDVLGAFYLESQGSKRERASEALRSVAGMGRTLAHEIKNPLAGIRGAAQLLKLGASPADVPLAQVIVDETDRIRRLVDQVEAFSDERAAPKVPINIHRILDRVRTLSASAFDGQVAFVDSYDPSLPKVLGDATIKGRCGYPLPIGWAAVCAPLHRNGSARRLRCESRTMDRACPPISVIACSMRSSPPRIGAWALASRSWPSWSTPMTV